MHHVNYFWINLGIAYVGKCILGIDIARLLSSFVEYTG